MSARCAASPMLAAMADFDGDRRALHWLGHWIRTMRLRQGTSQRALARAAGVDQAWLSRVERGLMPRASALLLAQVLVVLRVIREPTDAPRDFRDLIW